MSNPKSLDDVRGKIDRVDDRIVELLAERFLLVSELSAVKRSEGLAVYQSDREREILTRLVAKGKTLGLNPLLLQALFLQIFAVSKRDQV